MSDNDSSGLSSVPSEDESNLQLQKKDGILKFFTKVDRTKAAATPNESPPPPEREPSPAHEYVLADNPDIAVRPLPHRRVLESLTRQKSRSTRVENTANFHIHSSSSCSARALQTPFRRVLRISDRKNLSVVL